jgi:hypothetical protein
MDENVPPNGAGPSVEGSRKDLEMRVSPTRWIVGTLAVGGLTLALSGSPVFAATSAKQLVKNAINATESASSVKISGAITQGSATISLNVSAGTGGTGQGTIGIGTGTATVRLVGGIVYFMGNKNFWTQQGSASAAQLFAGKWVKTAATTSSGKSLAEFLDSETFMKQLFDSNLTKSAFKEAGSAKVGGKSAIAVSGHDAKNTSFGKLFVAKSGKPYILRITIGGKDGTGALNFSNYNKAITPVVPAGAIDLDTLTQSG